MGAREALHATRATCASALSLTIAATVAALGTTAAGAQEEGTQAAGAQAAGPPAAGAQAPEPGRVAAAPSRILVERHQFATPTGATVVVHGRLRPGRAGAKVQLMTRARSRWQTLAVGRTWRDGRFGIRYRVRGLGSTWVRVRFAGSRRARAASAAAGRIVALAPIVASWYDDAGNTACGFHATFGVANRTLPCGTRVTFSYGGRTVVATVDDRGPYIYGRSFDLNQNTARYLGMWGVATVFASV